MKYSWNQPSLMKKKESEVGVVACLNDEQQFLILRRSPIWMTARDNGRCPVGM